MTMKINDNGTDRDMTKDEENAYLANAKIAAAGSCFDQHISKHLRAYGYHVLDVEPPPPGLPEEKHKTFGFSIYSARYGNIYTARQLLQLAKEALGEWTPQDYVWEKNSKFYDGLRPAVEPEGHNSREAVIEHRQYHLEKTRDLFKGTSKNRKTA